MSTRNVRKIRPAARDFADTVSVASDLLCSQNSERELEKRFGIQKAILVPTSADSNTLTQNIAHAAGVVISKPLKPSMAVGVGWGRTLQLSVNSIQRKPSGHISVVSLLGGLTRGSAMNSYEIASRLVDIFRADCFYIIAPAFTHTEKTAKLFRSQSSVRDAFEHARKVDIAFLSVGSLHPTSTMSRLGLVNKDDVKSLRVAGAVGDFCTQWIDVKGNIVDHPLNRRVITLPVDQLQHIPLVILASGGEKKCR